MKRHSFSCVASVFVVGVIGLTGCNGNPAPSTLTTSVTPMVITLAKSQSFGILPENCNDWLSPSWVTPQNWWNSLRPNQSPHAVGEAAVGFEIQFDTSGNCSKYRQNLYRAGFAYDLSQQTGLKNLVTKAELSFFSAILPAGVSPTGLCQPVTAGGGSLMILHTNATLPAAPSAFADLGAGPSAQAFPASGRVFGMTFPWISGQITSGVQTGVTVTTVATGMGGASFTVDVTSYVNGALNRGDASIAFMLSGSDETVPTVFPAGAIDCKTSYKVGNLVIEHI
jgi:hypothetical protein